ncbi:hypothetical protein DSO57_1031405 [Entomophthora muscae]|nr:hypothetical protein DSO57_1031405 [Entomophthora muscae]
MEDQEALRASEASLAKKSKIYDKLAQDAPEFDEMDDTQLIDFERKKMDAPEPKEAPKKTFFDDDPWVEYIDEFGRTRLLRQSEARELQASDGEVLSDDRMSVDVKKENEREEWERQREERNKGPIHYDATQEHRTRGVGFYKFSNIEEERREQMEQLKKLREDTDRKRALQQSIQEKRNGQLQDRIRKISLLHSSRNPKLLFPAPYFASGQGRLKGKRPTDIDIKQFTPHVLTLLNEVRHSLTEGS